MTESEKSAPRLPQQYNIPTTGTIPTQIQPPSYYPSSIPPKTIGQPIPISYGERYATPAPYYPINTAPFPTTTLPSTSPIINYPQSSIQTSPITSYPPTTYQTGTVPVSTNFPYTLGTATLPSNYQPSLGTYTTPYVPTEYGRTTTESEVEYIPYQKSYTDYVPVEKTEYVPVTKVEYVPVEKQYTDYYAVQHIIEQIPQLSYEKKIEYVPVERLEEKIEYIPTKRSFIHSKPEQGLQTTPLTSNYYTTYGAQQGITGIPSPQITQGITTFPQTTTTIPPPGITTGFPPTGIPPTISTGIPSFGYQGYQGTFSDIYPRSTYPGSYPSTVTTPGFGFQPGREQIGTISGTYPGAKQLNEYEIKKDIKYT